jgi:hypothetical protein
VPLTEPHRIETRPSAARVTVVHDGQVLAESDRALELHERGLPVRYYLPREDVRMDLLTPSPTRSHARSGATRRTSPRRARATRSGPTSSRSPGARTSPA